MKIEKDWAKIKISDKGGNQSILYVAIKNSNLGQFDLPPVPPAGVFDVRYSTQRNVELFNSSKEIFINSAVYPVEINVDGVELRIRDKTTDGKLFNAIVKNGQKVNDLISGERESGTYEVEFDASNLSSGVYFYQLKTESFTQIRKLMLMK